MGGVMGMSFPDHLKVMRHPHILIYEIKLVTCLLSLQEFYKWSHQAYNLMLRLDFVLNVKGQGRRLHTYCWSI